MRSPESARGLAERLVQDARLPHTVRLDVGGCRIDVATNSAELSARMLRYFRDVLVASGQGHGLEREEPSFRILAVDAPALDLDGPWVARAPEPGKSRIKEEWLDLPDGRVVRKRLTGMLFVFGGPLHVAYGSCLRNDNQVVNFVINRYMQWRLGQGYFLAHAGAVAREGVALALCGRPGAGKSTTALGLVAAGLDFVSNDRLLFKKVGDHVEVQGVPKHPRVNPGTLLFNPLLEGMIPEANRVRLRALPPAQLKALEQKRDVLIDQVFGAGRFRMQAELGTLVVFNWSDAGEPRSRPVDLALRADLLPTITKSPGLFYEAGPGHAPPDLSDAAYVEALSGTRVVEVTGRQDFEAARRLCLEALAPGAVVG